MTEENAFNSWYRPVHEKKGPDGTHSIFQDTLTAFSSELSKDKRKLGWIIESGHGNVESILAAVVEARVNYEMQRGNSKVREALVAFSEKMHHYSGIMDVLVSHHPEYTALAYGAIRVLFVGVVNHQKLLTQLCTGLSDIANSLPRAALIMRLYATPQIRKIIVDMYANILKFLLRALSWYQESKAMHVIHAITRPAELRYNDLLATIASLSRAMTENAWASSHAEQRDMHTDITTLINWKPHIETKVDELMTHMLEIKKCVIAEQAINASARLDVSQKLSEIQLAQVLQHISVLNLPEPIKAFQASLFMSKRRQAKPSNRGPPFWLDAKVQRWNNSMESSLIMINGTRHGSISSTSVDKTTADQVSTIDLLKYLVQQAIKLNENIHADAALAPRLGAHLRAQTEEDWIRVLASVLQGIPLIYVVLDIEVLSQFLEPLAKCFWPNAFCGLFAELSARSINTVVRVVLVSYGSPLLKGPFGNDNQGHVVTVGGTSQIGRPTGRLAFRNRAPSSATKGASLNLEAIADSHQARGRMNRQLSRLRRAK
ncbi:hypothetical protein E0Z10_g1563 [Xylaria hypoxylon]|uniref:DUF7708 domain-containing protein n=1 Tax=Xylaria hypoxylon TaxID=37992 RepID=A0A4Z0Z6G1_9PEZI|nr:hypothetical protein E0Z10_g1563 [Xylaria hypoxylon]